MGLKSKLRAAALATATIVFAACANDPEQTLDAGSSGGEASGATQAAIGAVTVQLEPIDGFFIEGFEVGLRFETGAGDVIGSTLWTDYVNEQVTDPSMDDYYDTVLRQEVPAGPVVVLATVNIGAGPPPEIPDLDGELQCRLSTDVPAGSEVAVEVNFDGGDDCLRELAELPTDSSASSQNALGPDEPLVSCGSVPYPPSAFDGPINAELADDDAARALRELIANPEGIETVPESGWRRLTEGDNTVVFGHGEPVNDGSEQGVVEITMRADGDGYAFYNSAHGCTPRAHAEGRSIVEFAIADGAELSASSTAIEVLVIEAACTGAAPVDDRLGTPQIRYGPSTIEVLFTAIPLDGEFHTCPGNPTSSTTLRLDEPLGDRRILDLSSYPPPDANDPERRRDHFG